jgi:hypothetical protein
MVGRPTMRMKNLIVGAIVCASMMLVAAPAFAQTASRGYSKPSGSIQERISVQHTPDPHKPPHTTIHEARSSNLPFTGLDVALIVAAGGVLLAMGFGMRRLSRSEIA